MFQTKVVGKVKTHFIYSNFSPKIMPLVRLCGKTWWSDTDHP